jgi:hypothetical protein
MLLERDFQQLTLTRMLQIVGVSFVVWLAS